MTEPPLQAGESSLPRADEILEFVGVPGSQGAICALLTPLVRTRLRTMQIGQLLEIQVDDPTAREDMASWCRLAGHELVAVAEDSPGILRIFVRKSHA